MSNDFFQDDGNPTQSGPLQSPPLRALFANVRAGFDKMPTLTAKAGLLVHVNSGATALESGAITSAQVLASVTDETGTGALVFATSPTLVTPALGTPASGVATNLTGTAAGLTAGSATTASAVTNGGALNTPASGVLTNCTGLPVSSGMAGLGTGVATFLATPSSANLAAALTDETGSGANVFATSPTLVTPLLGTPTSGVLTNCTGYPGDAAQTLNAAAATAASHAVRADQIQLQSVTAFTTTNTGAAFLGAPTPAITANAAGLRFNITLHTAPTGSPTLAVSGKTALNFKYYDSTGTKQFITAAVAPSGWNSDVINDGTDWVMQKILPTSITVATSAEVTTGTDNAKMVTPLAAQALAIKLATQQASTSGTAIDFTGIPAGTKRITVMLNGVSTNGSSIPIIQIGDSGGIEATGYVSGASSTASAVTSIIGFPFASSQAATYIHTGSVCLTLIDAATFSWIASGSVTDTVGVNTTATAGSKSLTATLDRVRITTTNGTDTFDAGAVNIMYEG